MQCKKRMGLVRRTVTEATQDAAIECALRLHGKGYSVLAVGTDAAPRIFSAPATSSAYSPSSANSIRLPDEELPAAANAFALR